MTDLTNDQADRLHDLANRLREQIQKCLDLDKNNKKGVNSDPRSLFQKEYDKIIFSDYFRAMANKTQISPLPDNDHTHTRLTHSLEVACIGYDFGERLLNEFEQKKIYPTITIDPQRRSPVKDPLEHLPVILASACLLHDIGNPPFGHAGEEAIQDFFKTHFKEKKLVEKFSLSDDELKDFTAFDGNANGFRIITRLAGKYPEYGEGKTGFSLSAITLASLLKYPFFAGRHLAGKAKFGFFQSEKDIFNNHVLHILQDRSLEINKRHPLVYFVEAADDICYTVMDFEDAFKNGNLKIEDLWNDFDIKTILHDFKDKDKLETAFEIIKKYDPNKPIHRKELKALEEIRSGIIGLLVDACFKNYIGEDFNKMQTGQVSHSLLKGAISFYSKQKQKPILEKFEATKKKYLNNILYCNDRNMKLELCGHKIINDLLELFLGALSDYKNKNFIFDDCSKWSMHLLRYLGIDQDPENKPPRCEDYYLCLIATDFITQCSDRYLIHLHKCFTDFE